MKMFYLGIVTALLGVSCASVCDKCCSKDKGGFAFEKKDNEVVITREGKLVAEYVYADTNILRPYFAHVHTLDGIKVTRNYPPVAGVDPVDHPTMHPGIWMAFGDIGGQDFWRNKASIRHEKFTREPAVKGGLCGRLGLEANQQAEVTHTDAVTGQHGAQSAGHAAVARHDLRCPPRRVVQALKVRIRDQSSHIFDFIHHKVSRLSVQRRPT